jgi:hypothetical protein
LVLDDHHLPVPKPHRRSFVINSKIPNHPAGSPWSVHIITCTKSSVAHACACNRYIHPPATTRSHYRALSHQHLLI